MSERSELIKSHITDEWQTIPQIVASCGLPWCDSTKSAAYRTLSSQHRFGLVDKRITGRIVEWRKHEPAHRCDNRRIRSGLEDYT